MSSSPTVIKFFPASSAIGFMFGRRGQNLRQIGGDLNRSDGTNVSIKFNQPTETTPGQFCIICSDPAKAEAAYKELRVMEDECINGRNVTHHDGSKTRERDWWSSALDKESNGATVTFIHTVIKSLAGIVLGKKSINLETARTDHFGVDIQVTNGEKECVITYEVAQDNELEAFKALQQLRRIEREAFAKSQTMCLNSQNRKKKATMSDGLAASTEQVVTESTE